MIERPATSTTPIHGLRGLWQRIRQSILRLTPRRHTHAKSRGLPRIPVEQFTADLQPAPMTHALPLQWADEDWDQWFPEECVRVDATGVTRVLMERAERDLGRWARFGAGAIPTGVAQLLAASARHMDRLRMDEPMKLPARSVLRHLISNLAEIGPGETVEMIQGLEGGAVTLVIQCRALAFERRYGAGVDATTAKAARERELADMLNPQWFSAVQTTRDGAALIFQWRETGAFE